MLIDQSKITDSNGMQSSSIVIQWFNFTLIRACFYWNCSTCIFWSAIELPYVILFCLFTKFPNLWYSYLIYI